MQDTHLRQLLGELPRHNASENFSKAVMHRVAARNTTSVGIFRSWGFAFVTAVATIVVALGATILTLEQREQARIEALQNQHRDLKAEIAALQAQVDFDPVIDLGQDNGVRYVLDLRPVEVQPAQTAALKPTFD